MVSDDVAPDVSRQKLMHGLALHRVGKLSDAAAIYQDILTQDPDHFDALHLMGVIAHQRGDPEQAADLIGKALCIDPNYAAAHSNRGVSLHFLNRLDEALASYDRAIALQPDYPEAYCNRANALKDGKRLKEALTNYEKAIALRPEYAEAHNNRGIVLASLGRLDEAIAGFAEALRIKPDFAEAHAQKLHLQSIVCDWDALTAEASAIPELGISGASVSPFTMLALEDDPARHRRRSEHYAEEHFARYDLSPIPRPDTKPQRLRIGYFSADFRVHPVAQLIARVLELHDREEFQIYAYSYGSISEDPVRSRLIRAVDEFYEVSALGDREIAYLAREHMIDIAVDLTGYTQNSRTRIFACRAAPIQINYLGYPGTMGAPFIDYMISDRNLAPEDFQKYYREKLIYLPNQYQAQDNTIPVPDISRHRSEFGLPEDAFVFCAINNNYKITPSEFDIWTRLLLEVKGSVLWLFESNRWAVENLRHAAQMRGVDPDRLIFAARVPLDTFLEQLTEADLFLDTFIYNSGATASNCLWAGLPIVTKIGKSYTARMAATLLRAIDLPELVTTTAEDYERLAFELATQPAKLAQIRQRLVQHRDSTPLFDTESFTKHIETAYQRAYQRYFDGKEPDVIEVE